MLNRQTSRALVRDMEQDAYALLAADNTPDSPTYVPTADALARKVLQLTEYLSQIDAQAKTATAPAWRADR